MTGARLTVPDGYTFMVTRKGRTMRPGSTLPRTRYGTLEAAATEAETQAVASPGTVMIVFQEVLRVKVDAADTDPAAIPPAAGGAGRHRAPKPSGSNRSEIPNSCPDPKGGA